MQLISHISHDDLKEMLSLSIWVHEVGEHVDESETCLSFTYGVDLSNVSEERKQAVQYLYRTQQSGLVLSYTDDIKDGLQVAVTVNTSSHRICVVFRGSDDRYVWINHARAQQESLVDGLRLHSGIKSLIDKHENALNRTIDGLLFRYPKYEVFVTGHSLGGALAVLVADALHGLATAELHALCQSLQPATWVITLGGHGAFVSHAAGRGPAGRRSRRRRADG